MYPGGLGGLVVIIGLVNIIWLTALTYFIWKNNLFVKQLFPDKSGNFRERLEEVLKEIASLEEFKKQTLEFVQKVALRRYNPYKDTGGDQSFSVALLDGKGDGVVISSLHSRLQTRVFAKPVSGGKEDKFEFSDEEKEIVRDALLKK